MRRVAHIFAEIPGGGWVNVSWANFIPINTFLPPPGPPMIQIYRKQYGLAPNDKTELNRVDSGLILFFKELNLSNFIIPKRFSENIVKSDSEGR
jgi:hypothetical protein